FRLLLALRVVGVQRVPAQDVPELVRERVLRRADRQADGLLAAHALVELGHDRDAEALQPAARDRLIGDLAEPEGGHLSGLQEAIDDLLDERAVTLPPALVALLGVVELLSSDRSSGVAEDAARAAFLAQRAVGVDDRLEQLHLDVLRLQDL